jgi:hypothetical protein
MKVPTPIRYLTEISNHIKEYFGDNSFILHEDKSSIVHVDIHVVRPSAERPFFTLLTSGMSDLNMKVPEGAEDFVLAEVCLCLPGAWPLAVDSFGWREPQFFWPIQLLLQAARYPHRHDTWLCWGHTIGDSEQPTPIDPQVDYTGVIFLEPLTFPDGAGTIETPDDRHINYLALIPLLPKEMAFEAGPEELAERLSEAGVSELLYQHRPSVI